MIYRQRKSFGAVELKKNHRVLFEFFAVECEQKIVGAANSRSLPFLSNPSLVPSPSYLTFSPNQKNHDNRRQLENDVHAGGNEAVIMSRGAGEKRGESINNNRREEERAIVARYL